MPIFVILMSVVLIIIRGALISKLWTWFLVPMGLQDISIAMAIGLSVLGQLISGSLPSFSKKKAEPADIVGAFIFALMLFGLMFLIGWLAHLSI
jgi:hypothetical protein